MTQLWCFGNKSSKHSEKGPKIGCRHGQAFLYFLFMTYAFCKRTVLSVAIVAMNNGGSSNPDIPVYDWKDQSVVLSAFFWGYVPLQIPTAHLGKKYGPKWVLVATSLVDSASCLLIPIMAETFGSSGVMVCRVFQGLSQGGIYPLIHTLLGNWAPPNERSRLATFSYAGSILGNILSFIVTGQICSSSLGWPASFYLFGALGIKWTILWAYFGADRPGVHKSISDAEKFYIQNSLGQEIHKVYKTPWKSILTSSPFWAITLAFVAANWGSSVLLTQLPTYLYKILNYKIQSNSLLSAAPYLAMWVGAFSFSHICDWLINEKIVSRGTARKIFNCIGTVLPAISFTLIGFIPTEKAGLSVALLIFNGGITAGGFCSFQVNHVDLAPNHSGILMSITNCSTSIFSILSPLVVQFIVTDQTDQHQWRIIFLITAGVYIVAAVVYLFLASGDVQPWNENSDEENITIEKEIVLDTEVTEIIFPEKNKY